MSVLLTSAVYINSVLTPVGTTVSLGYQQEQALVSEGVGTWVSTPTTPTPSATYPGFVSSVTGPTGAVSLQAGANAYAPKGLVPAGLTTSHIIDVMNYLAARGGGVVSLAPDTYTHTADIPLITGVEVVGAPLGLSFTGNIPDSGFDYSGGSRILGTGTETAFYGNNVDQGSPAAQFAANAISGANLSNIVFDSLLYAVDAGAVNNMGLYSTSIKNIVLINSGMNIENFLQCNFKRIFGKSTGTTEDAIRFASSIGYGTFVPGNSVLEHVYKYTSKRLHKGFIFEAAAGCGLNELTVPRIQANTFTEAAVSESVSMTNTSANIGVADGTKYAVDMPVMFTSTANGFTANYIYFVTSVAGNVIQVSNNPRGTAVSATGSAAITMQCAGHANIMLLGLGGINNSKFYSMNLETTSSVAFVGRNVDSCRFVFSGVTSGAQNHCVMRTALDCIVEAQDSGLKTDFDNASATTGFFGRRGTITNRTGWGSWNGHSYGSSATQYAAGTGLGTGPTIATPASCDSSGTFSLTTGTSPAGGANTTVLTVTFGMPKEYGYISLIPMNAAAVALQQGANALRMQDPARSTGFDLVTDGTLAASTLYKFAWMSI